MPPATRWPDLPSSNQTSSNIMASEIPILPPVLAVAPPMPTPPMQASPVPALSVVAPSHAPQAFLPTPIPTHSNAQPINLATGTTPSPIIASPDDPVTLETFRCLLGIPQHSPPLPRSESDARNDRSVTRRLFAPVRRHDHIPKWLRLQSCHPEAATSTYFAILKEESSTWRAFYFYDAFVYLAMIIQLCLSSALIILGALRMEFHIAIAMLGAVNGIITGLLSLIRGQGLPNRLLQYADGLRRVREDIEWTERILRANATVVMYKDVISLRDSYELCRDDAVKNHPDTWNSGLSPQVGLKGPLSTVTKPMAHV
jgi:hypothetical protein